jgi:serine/threonine-protein kinase
VAAVRAGVPADLDRLVGHLLAKNPADRPATVAEVRARLAGVSPQSRPTSATPAARADRPIRAQAAVPYPTRAMPDLADELPATTGRVRFGPVGIAAAVVLGITVLLVAFAVGTSGSGRQGSGAGQDGSSATQASATQASTAPRVSTPATAGGPAQAVAAVKLAIQTQAEAGQIDAEAAGDLTGELDEIGDRIAEGDPREAAAKVADLRRRLAGLRRSGKVTTAGYEAVLPSLDLLAASLPPAKQDRKGKG